MKLKSINNSDGSKIKEEDDESKGHQDGDSKLSGDKNFHISFRDQVQRRPLMKVFEVESYKKYNSDQEWWADLPCTIF